MSERIAVPPQPRSERAHRWQLLLIGALSALVLVAMSWWLYRREAAGIEGRLAEREAVRVGLFAHFLKADLQPAIVDLLILADGDGLRSYLGTGDAAALERAAQRAIFVSRLRDEYHGIGFVDLDGREVLRVNRRGSRAAAEALRNTSDRAYFRKALSLNPGQVYVSALDLVGEPGGGPAASYRPIIHFAAPVFGSDGRRRGIYVIDYRIDRLIERLLQSAPPYAHRLRLLDDSGHWLKAADPAHDWSAQFIERNAFALPKTDPALWSRIAAAPIGQLKDDGGLLSWRHLPTGDISPIGPGRIVAEHDFLVVASQMSAPEFADVLVAVRGNITVLTAALLALLAGCLWFFRMRQQALDVLRRSEERLRVTLNSIGDAVLTTDVAGNVVGMNPIAEALTGWRQHEASGRPIAEVFNIINDVTRLPAPVPVDDVLASGKIHGLANHTVLIARDGVERAIADSAAPILEADSRILGVVLVFRDVSAEYAAEKALRDSEQRYRTLFESIDEGFAILQMIFDENDRPIDYRFLQVNPSFEKQTGYADAQGRTMREFAADLDAFWYETFGRVAVTGESVRLQGHASPLRRTYDVYAFRFGEPDQRQVAILFNDITERERAKAELDQFFSLSLDFLCISSADGYFKRVSPAVTDMLGWSVEEFLRTPYIDMVHPDDREATLAEVSRQMSTGEKVLHFENRYRHRDGTWRMLSWRSVPYGDLMYATARDVTERHQAEQMLRASNETLERRVRERTSELERTNASLQHSERRFRALIEHGADGIAVIDAANNILYLSPAVRAIEGYAPDELYGRTGLEHTHPNDLQVVADAVSKVLSAPGQPVPVLWRRRHKKGHWIWLEGHATNMLDDPAVKGIVTNYRDVTERKRSEEKLRHYAATLARSNRELQDFAFVASHDLQEPLRKIQAFGDRLITRCGDMFDPTGRDYMERIRSAAERMRKLIDDLLMFSRLTSKAKQFEAVDLAVIAAEVVSDLEIRLEQEGGSVDIGPLPMLEADPTQMRQLLQNLIGNALKFRRSEVAPAVTIRSVQTGGQMILTVADNGIGFDEVYAEQIFQVFQRLHARQDYEGSGIGLAVCRKIAEWHGGSIVARSQPGVGSTFEIHLPLRQVQPEEGSA